MGRWKYRANSAAHKRARDALLPGIVWGETLCYRCRHPLQFGDQPQLDHADDGSYGGFSHGSPCRICEVRCNPSAGGRSGALASGKRLRERPCVICGKWFTASNSSDGARAATCGRTECVTEIKRIRKAHLPDPEPPGQSGRAW